MKKFPLAPTVDQTLRRILGDLLRDVRGEGKLPPPRNENNQWGTPR